MKKILIKNNLEDVEIMGDNWFDVVEIFMFKNVGHHDSKQINDIVKQFVQFAPLELFEGEDNTTLEQTLHHWYLTNKNERMGWG